jgi:hypothetical protein
MKSNEINYEECEMTILKTAVKKIEKKMGMKKLNNPRIKDIIKIVEQFLKDKERICYGGTAINNILPEKDQFYDKNVEFPDYDFFSPTPLEDAKKLADIYYAKGYNEVEAKSGAHEGTFKVYVNFLPVADITFLVPELYKNILKKSIKVNSIYYCPPTYLRMAMYLELSRPDGDVSRWEKVLKRLTLLNKNFPFKGNNCNVEDVQRLFQYGNKELKQKLTDKNEKLNLIEEKIYQITRDTFVKEGGVFFGAMANKFYLKKMPSVKNKKIPMVPDFDVLFESPEKVAKKLIGNLNKIGIKNIKVEKHKGVGEIIATHYEVKVGGETIAFLYEPLACHSYNVVKHNNQGVKIASIDTMLSFYLAFIYIDRPYYDINRLLCMGEFLFAVQKENRLRQSGILKRFSMDCYGRQLTLEKMRKHKKDKYVELKNKKNTKEYEWFFLNYSPIQEKATTKTQNNKKPKKGAKKTKKKSVKKKSVKKKGVKKKGTKKKKKTKRKT